MENSLGKLKNIEASLLQMKSRLQNISRNQAKSIESIEKAFSTSISVMNQKLEECKKQNEKKQKLATKFQFKQSRIQIIKEQKLINQKQLAKSRQILNSIKINESQQIKTQSIANSKAILQIKNAYLQQNQQFTKKIKEEKSKSKAKVQEYHVSKTKQLREHRQKQNQQNQRRIIKLKKQMAALSEKEHQIQSRYKQRENLLANLKNAVRKIQKMKVQEFMKIKDKIQIDQGKLKDEDAQKILNQIISSQGTTVNFITQ